MAAFKKFLSTTKNKMIAQSKSHKRPSGLEADEEFERRKQQWQKDVEEMSDFLVIKSTEEQRAEGVQSPVDTAYIDDRDGLPILKAVFDIHHFQPDDVMLTVENTSGEESDGEAQRQLVLFAQLTDDSRECSLFKKTMLRRIDLPHFVETRWMHCRLGRTPDTASRLTIELPFHLPPQRRPTPGPGIVPIVTGADGCRLIRFAVPIGPEFTVDEVAVEVDSAARQVLVTALFEAEIGHYGTEVTQHRLRRVFRLPDVSLEFDSVRHSLGADGRLFIEIQLKPMQPYKCDMTTEELQLVNDVVDDASSMLDVDSTADPVPGPSSYNALQNDVSHVHEAL